MGSGRVAGLVALLLAGACGPGQPVADVTPAASTTGTEGARTTVDARAADLDELVEFVARHHPEPPDVGPAVATLGDRAADLTDEQFLAGLMELTAGREGDGHTGIFPLAQPDLALWPLQLYDFDDGWRVVAALEPHADLVGGEVTAVGGIPVEAAAAAVGSLVPRDNDASLRGRVPQYLVAPAVLTGLGLDATITVDGEVLAPEPVPAEDVAGWLDLFDPLVCPPLPRSTERLWDIERPGDGVVVARYRRTVDRADGWTGVGFAEELEQAVDEVGEPVLVVDLRDNPGGEIRAYAPLLAAVQRIATTHPGAVRLVVNRCTFSAASQLVAEALATTDATVVGETMGGTTRQWGDARTTSLPGSGVVVHVATRWHDRGGSGVPTVVVPDVVVPVTWEGHVAGIDPAIDRGPGVTWPACAASAGQAVRSVPTWPPAGCSTRCDDEAITARKPSAAVPRCNQLSAVLRASTFQSCPVAKNPMTPTMA